MTSSRPSPPRHIALTFNPERDNARGLAFDLQNALLQRGVGSRIVENPQDGSELEQSDLVICLGGDGTVLRCARLLMESETLILGVNSGRLGFLTEMDGPEAIDRLDEVLAGNGRIETRTMIQAVVSRTGQTLHGLNEAVIGRATLSRPIQLAVNVNGSRIGDYLCDGVIVASATGSTAYALSVGGPILPPESQEIVVVPVAPHLAAQHAIVLPGNDSVQVMLEPGQQAVLSIDGETDFYLDQGDSVIVGRSPYRARFLRLKAPSDFYKRVAARLGWHRPAGNSRPLPPPAGSVLGEPSLH